MVAAFDWEVMAIDQKEILNLIFRERNEFLAYINSFLNDFYLAEDCFQEVALAALAKGIGFEDSPHVIRWALRVARNKAIDLARKRERQPSQLPEDVFDLLEEQWAVAISRNSSEVSSGVTHLVACVEDLAPHSRKLVALRYFDGLKSSRVAEVVEMKKESVYQALTRALAVLRKCVAQKRAEGTQSTLQNG